MKANDIKMMVAVDPALLEEIKIGQAEVAKLIAAMHNTINNFDRYAVLPEWLNTKLVFRIEEIPFTDRRAIYKWEDRGVIRSRLVGRNKLYNKADCIDFLNRRDRWKIGLPLEAQAA